MRERKRIRLRNYDYSNPGKYFVTICTQKMEPYFGKIKNSKILLSEVGEIANQFWEKIPLHFKNVELHEFVIMPDHMHGIIEIIAGKKDTASIANKINVFGPQKKGSIPAVIGQYKSSVTRWCNKNNHSYFAWQRRYHDHVIRNTHELRRIQEYIFQNPYRWEDDKM